MQPFQAQLSRTASDHISGSVPLARPSRSRGLTDSKRASRSRVWMREEMKGRLAKLVARLVDRLAGAKAGVATPCEGHAWCDSMERQLVDDIASNRRTRF